MQQFAPEKPQRQNEHQSKRPHWDVLLQTRGGRSMGKQTRREFLEEHDDEVFTCFFCDEDVERDAVVVRHEDTFDPMSELVPAHRKCHNENTSVL